MFLKNNKINYIMQNPKSPEKKNKPTKQNTTCQRPEENTKASYPK